MKNVKLLFIGAAICIAASACNDDDDDIFTSEDTFYGASQSFHGGTVRSFVTVGADGNPVSMGIRISENTLAGLPSDTGAHPAEIRLSLPAEGAVTGIDHIDFSWNPHGHPPVIYSLPHFDLHFYMVTPAEQAAVIPGPDTVVVPAQYIPADYISTVVAEPNMGVHYVDTTAAELRGQTFTSTFIYGFYQGEMTFFEPMFTRDFLVTKSDFTAEVKQPSAFQKTGYYPASYEITFDDDEQEYVITLAGLEYQQATP